MKLKYLILALIPLGLAACQSTTVSTSNSASVVTAKTPQILSAYHWQIDTNNTRPMVLGFDESGHFNIQTTCNTLIGSWKVSGSQLVTGSLGSTMKGCSPNAVKQEQLASKIFNEKPVNYSLNTSNLNAPTLTLTAADGKSYTFTGKMTSETKYQSQGETIFLEISPQTKSCQGVTTQTCLQVKEIKYNEQGLKVSQDANWKLFYDPIEGFTHNPKLEQIIRVKRYEIKKPAADQSKYAYVHDMTIMSGIIK